MSLCPVCGSGLNHFWLQAKQCRISWSAISFPYPFVVTWKPLQMWLPVSISEKINLLHEMLADTNAEAVGLGHINSDYVLFATDCFHALFSTINLCVKLSGLLVLIGSYFLLRKPRKIWERRIKPIGGSRQTAPWLGLLDCPRSRNDL